jgi:hypothetical protein
MQIESKNSVMALVKNVSKNGASSIAMKKIEYDYLIEELWNKEEHLKTKYIDPSSVPQIYTLFGVKIEVL